MSVARVYARLAARLAVLHSVPIPGTLHPSTHITSVAASAPRAVVTLLDFRQARLYSAGLSRSNTKLYDFKSIQKLLAEPARERVIVDVREPSEYQAGFIPSAVNIPITSQPDALLLSEEDFEDRFGFAKPEPSKEVIFYCKAGIRSAAAVRLAEEGGYQYIGEYRGSWLDWQKNGGHVERP